MTTPRTVLRGVGGVDLHEPPTSIFCFVGDLVCQVRPSRVSDGLGEAVVFDHPVHAQVLDRDEPVTVHELARLLVREVLALVLNALVDRSHCLAAFRSLFGALRGFGESALGAGQVFLFLAKELRSRDALTVGRGDDILESNVHAHGFARLRDFFGLNLTREAHEPLARGAFANRGGLHRSSAIERTMDHGLNMAYLREEDPALLDLKATLRIRERVVSVSPTKARIARSIARLHAAEERLESKIKPESHVLQNLRVDFPEDRVRLFEFRKPPLLVVPRRALTRFFESSSPFRKELVVQSATFSQGLNHRAFLSGSRMNPVSKGFFVHRRHFSSTTL